MTLSRRELFGFLRPRTDATPAAAPEPEPAAAPVPAPFSLDGFYRDRAAPAAPPPFAVRTTVTAPTTRVGVGPTAATADRVPAAVAVPADGAGLGEPVAIPAVPAGQVPQVLAEACLATRTFCSVCSERCPRPGAIVVIGGRPRIVADACDGCGRCLAVCPAPVLALVLVARPAPNGVT